MKTLDQKIAAAEAELAELRKKARDQDTRKKAIVGALVLKQAATYPETKTWLDKLLHAGVERDGDRRLFGLPPKPRAESKPETVVRFPAQPPEGVTSELKRIGMKWDGKDKSWRGNPSDPDSLRPLVEPHGGTVQAA